MLSKSRKSQRTLYLEDVAIRLLALASPGVGENGVYVMDGVVDFHEFSGIGKQEPHCGK